MAPVKGKKYPRMAQAAAQRAAGQPRNARGKFLSRQAPPKPPRAPRNPPMTLGEMIPIKPPRARRQAPPKPSRYPPPPNIPIPPPPKPFRSYPPGPSIPIPFPPKPKRGARRTRLTLEEMIPIPPPPQQIKRGRGRPKGSKNKREISAEEKFLKRMGRK